MKKTEQEKFLTKWLKKNNMYASRLEWTDAEVMDFATAWAEQVNKNINKPDDSGSLATLEGELKKIEDYFENKTYDGGVTPMDTYKARRREKIQKAIALIKDIQANED